MPGKSLGRRLTRLEAEATERQVHRLAAACGRSVGEARRALARARRELRLHPAPVLPNARVDLAPSILRLAAEFGLDPDVALARVERVLAEHGWLAEPGR